jgi:hypothetical protein
MKSVGVSKSELPPQDGRPSEIHLARFQDDRLVKWQAVKFFVLANEDANHYGVGLALHFRAPSLPQSWWKAVDRRPAALAAYASSRGHHRGGR